MRTSPNIFRILHKHALYFLHIPDLQVLRFLFILFTVSHAFIGVIIYLLLDTTLPYKDEEEQEMFDYGPRPRRRKEAEPIHDQNDSPFF